MGSGLVKIRSERGWASTPWRGVWGMGKRMNDVVASPGSQEAARGARGWGMTEVRCWAHGCGMEQELGRREGRWGGDVGSWS